MAGACSDMGRRTASSRPAPHTGVEKKARFLMVCIVPDKSADASIAAQSEMFRALPAAARISVTHDNGTGSAHHARLRE